MARKTYIADWGADVARMSQFDGNIKICVLDKSAWGQRGEKKQIWEQFRDASGISPVPSDSDRPSGKLLLHEYLRWQPRRDRYVPNEGFNDDTHQRLCRLYGDDKGREYLRMFEPQAPETNLPKLQIFNHCEGIINVLPSCVYAHDKTTGKKKEDVEEFNGDDPYDGMRYLIKRAHQYLAESKEVFAEKKKLGSIMMEFDQTGDYNHLYRRMERYESDQAGDTGAVARGDRPRGYRH